MSDDCVQVRISSESQGLITTLVKYCQFGVLPVNHSDSDSDANADIQGNGHADRLAKGSKEKEEPSHVISLGPLIKEAARNQNFKDVGEIRKGQTFV